jgi:glycosyltransferase involved in cell wall biosynthesis
MISIYFFIPCFNEQLRFDKNRWIRFISSLDFEFNVNFKFFFINDGSTDDTNSILNQLLLSNSKLKKSSISIINFDENIGKGVSLKRTINSFGRSADYIFYIDSDWSFIEPDILEIIKLTLTH